MLKARSLRQAANSASTAKVTNTFISSLSPEFQRARLRRRPLQVLRSQLHFFRASRGNIAIGPIPAHCTLQRSSNRARLETQFALRPRNVHKHLVLGDLDA